MSDQETIFALKFAVAVINYMWEQDKATTLAFAFFVISTTVAYCAAIAAFIL